MSRGFRKNSFFFSRKNNRPMRKLFPHEKIPFKIYFKGEKKRARDALSYPHCVHRTRCAQKRYLYPFTAPWLTPSMIYFCEKR